jgi:hypothetical protein
MSTTFKIQDGDFVDNSATGRPIMLMDRDAVKQSIGENLSIKTLSNGFGAGIQGLVGTIPVDDTTMTMMLDSKIRNSITAMISLQTQNDVTRTTTEKLTGISFLKVVQDTSDPRRYLYYLDVATVAGPAIRVSGQVVR